MHFGTPFSKGRHNREHRIFVNHARRTRRRNFDPLEVGREFGAQVSHRLAALFAQIFIGQVCAHLDQRGKQPRPRRIEANVGHKHIRTFSDNRRTDRKGRRARVARHSDILSFKLGLTLQANDTALGGLFRLDCRAKASQHSLGVVPRRFTLNNLALAARI